MLHQSRQGKAKIIMLVLLMLVVSFLLPFQETFAQSFESMVLVIEPDIATIYIGDTQQYRAYLSNDGKTLGKEVTEECSWNINNTEIGEATATKGLFKGVASGETTVAAQYVSQSLSRAPIRAVGRAVLKVEQWRGSIIVEKNLFLNVCQKVLNLL